jgi:hypothetical protein
MKYRIRSLNGERCLKGVSDADRKMKIKTSQEVSA